MFNSYHKYNGTSKIEVTENRAPTDESIRLYDEMRQKAVDSGVAAGAAPFDAHVTWNIFNRADIQGTEILGKFTLNCKDYKLRAVLPRRELTTPDDVAKIPAIIRNALADQLANSLTEDLIRTHHSSLVS